MAWPLGIYYVAGVLFVNTIFKDRGIGWSAKRRQSMTVASQLTIKTPDTVVGSYRAGHVDMLTKRLRPGSYVQEKTAGLVVYTRSQATKPYVKG